MEKIKHYTIAIQRWPFPFYKKYKVIDHAIDALGPCVRINLLQADGLSYVVPGLDRKRLKIYPDYYDYQDQQDRAAIPPTAALE